MEMTDLVHLLSIPECAAQLRGRHGPDKVHTSLAVFTEERVVLWDLDGETLRVENQLTDRSSTVRITALDTSRIWVGQSEERGVGDVVVHELPPPHHVVGVQLTGGVHVRDDVDAHQAGRGQGCPGLGNLRPPDPVTVLREESSLEGSVGGAPERVVKIVTGT